MVLKSFACMLLAFALALAENIAVMDISHEGITKAQAQVMVLKLQSELLQYDQYKVIERQELESILKEQGLQLTGLIEPSVSVGKIAGITKTITGTVGYTESMSFIALKLMDVESGEVLKSDYLSIDGRFEALVHSCGYALERLFGETRDGRFIPKQKNVQVHVHKEEVKHEVHVYQHVPGTHDKKKPMRKVYQPCTWCGGKGYTCEIRNRLEQNIDCPHCSRFITYQGKETHFKPLTGWWVTK